MIDVAFNQNQSINRLPNSFACTPPSSEHKTHSVLFVCWANVCRSPAGQSVLSKLVKASNLQENFHIDSAGVAVKDRELRPSAWMRWTAFRRGYRLPGRPRRIMRMDLENFDHVIAMDHQVLYSLKSIHSNPISRISLLGEFLPSHEPLDVPDPMNHAADRCNQVFDMLEKACPRIIQELCPSANAADPTRTREAKFDPQRNGLNVAR